MSDDHHQPSPPADADNGPAAAPGTPSLWPRLRPWVVPRVGGRTSKQTLARVLLRIGFWYVVLAIMIGFLQRSLIYYPFKQAVIATAEAELPPGQVHDITTVTPDGIELHGWHVLPDGQTGRDRDECDRLLKSSRCVVLFFSGNGANRSYRSDEFQLFTSLGAHVLIFDYRGYGENAGSPSEKGLATDARAAWKYATAERGVGPERIVLYGESLGGAVAVRLAAEMCDAGTPPAALVVRSTFSSVVETGQYHYPWLPVGLLLVDRFESNKWIAGVTCPFLQLHGARDTIVPIDLARRLFSAAPQVTSAGFSKRFVELPQADHNDVLIVAEAKVREAIGEFLGGLELP